MKRHLVSFKNSTELNTYLAAGDIWLPRVAVIFNGDSFSLSTAKLNIKRLGTKFCEICNDGVMYFFDMTVDGKSYAASTNAAGDLVITSTDTSGTTAVLVDDSNILNIPKVEDLNHWVDPVIEWPGVVLSHHNGSINWATKSGKPTIIGL